MSSYVGETQGDRGGIRIDTTMRATGKDKARHYFIATGESSRDWNGRVGDIVKSISTMNTDVKCERHQWF